MIKLSKRSIFLMMFLFWTLCVEAQSYNQFNLSTLPVNVSITNHPEGLSISNQLNNKGLNEKESALAMAFGYCIFLDVSGVETDLVNAQFTQNQIDSVLSYMNVNEWLATAFVESEFLPGGSGYYQIDNSPGDMFTDITCQSWSKLLGRLDYNYKEYVYYSWAKSLSTDVLYQYSQKGFVWESIEKGKMFLLLI